MVSDQNGFPAGIPATSSKISWAVASPSLSLHSHSVRGEALVQPGVLPPGQGRAVAVPLVA